MGKATIVSGGSGGLYTVALQYDNTRLDAQITALTAKIAKLTEELIPAAEKTITAESNKLKSLLEQLDADIKEYNSSSGGGGGGASRIDLVAHGLADAKAGAEISLGTRLFAQALASADATSNLRTLAASGLASAAAIANLGYGLGLSGSAVATASASADLTA